MSDTGTDPAAEDCKDSNQAFRVDRIGVVMVTDRAKLPPGALRGRIDETTGFLHVKDSKIARSGTLRYSDGKSEWMEYRSDSTIERAADSFSGVVFTKDHPPELVTADNVSRYQAGHVGNVRKDGSFLIADEIVITRRDAIERAKQPGGWELSIGFLTDVIRQDGTAPDGVGYQYLQTNLEGNHLAGVDQGRAGPECRLSMDSAYSVSAISEPSAIEENTATAEESTMNTQEKADAEKPVESDEDMKKKDMSEEDEEKGDAEEAEETDMEEKESDKKDKKKEKGDSVDVAKMVIERTNLVRHAESILGAEKFDESADNETIRLAVIAKVDGKEVMEKAAEMSEEAQRATFDAAIRSHKKMQRVDTAAQIAGVTAAVHFDGAEDAPDLADALAGLNSYYRDAHRSPVGKGLE
jgi:hypothetical protein